MKEYSISAIDFSYLTKVCSENGLTTFGLSWDGRGGIEFDFKPVINDKSLNEAIQEYFEKLMEEMKIIWNADFSITAINEGYIDLKVQEIMNVSAYDEVSITAEDIMGGQLYDHIVSTYDIEFDVEEIVMSVYQTGDYNGQYDSSFSLTIYKDNEVILSLEDDESCAEIIGKEVHDYIMSNHVLFEQNAADYDFQMEEYQRIDLTILPEEYMIRLKLGELL